MAEYGTILTSLGERLIAAHLLEGDKLELTELAVGDGGGAAYQPDADMTALRGECWRGPLNQVGISESSPNVIVVDALIPAEVGGFTVREAGVFDREGNLIGIMNTPATQKVASTDGATTEQYIQMLLAVTSAEGVQISVDASLVMATRRELEEHDKDAGAHAMLRERMEAHIGDADNPHAVNSSQIATSGGGVLQNRLDDLHGRITALESEEGVASAVAAHNESDGAHMDIRAVLSDKATLYDTTASYEDGIFTLTGTPDEFPPLCTLRFVAPANYTEGDAFRAGEQALSALSQTMESLNDNAFASGALVQIDVDAERGYAFFRHGGGASADIGELYILALNFTAALVGKSFTVTGGGMNYTGTVPTSLQAVVEAPAPNTTYAVTCDGFTGTVAVGQYYGVYQSTVVGVSSVLNDNSWELIAQIAAAGEAEKYWSVGDEKVVNLSSGGTATFRIEDFNHDDLAEGDKAPITFGMKNLLADTYSMRTSASNAGGWGSSAMRTSTIPTLLSRLPSDLQAVIKPVIKRTTSGSASTEITTTTDSLWLFSLKELGLQTTVAGYVGEGDTYPLYVSDTSRIKYLSDGSSVDLDYWTRSPNIAGITAFGIVTTAGTWRGSSASYSHGVCLGFCI